MFVLTIWLGYQLNVTVGLDSPPRKGTFPDQVWSWGTTIIALAVGVYSGQFVAGAIEWKERPRKGRVLREMCHADPKGAPPLTAFRERGLVVDEKGLRIRQGFWRSRVAWSDLACVELVGGPTTADHARWMGLVVVTRHQQRIEVEQTGNRWFSLDPPMGRVVVG